MEEEGNTKVKVLVGKGRICSREEIWVICYLAVRERRKLGKAVRWVYRVKRIIQEAKKSTM